MQGDRCLHIAFFVSAGDQNRAGELFPVPQARRTGYDVATQTQPTNARKRCDESVNEIAEPGDSLWNQETVFRFDRLVPG